jgi:hypothetical protein
MKNDLYNLTLKNIRVILRESQTEIETKRERETEGEGEEGGGELVARNSVKSQQKLTQKSKIKERKRGWLCFLRISSLTYLYIPRQS